MGYHNDLFRKKFNELDKICKAKFDMFYDEHGKRENKSAIYEFAETLDVIDKERLKSIVKLRNMIIHEDVAEVNDDVIKDVTRFIALAKKLPQQKPKTKNLSPKTPHKKYKKTIFGLIEDKGDSDYSKYDSYSNFYKNLFNLNGSSSSSSQRETSPKTSNNSGRPTFYNNSGLALNLDIIKLVYKFYDFDTQNIKFTSANAVFDIDTKGNDILIYSNPCYDPYKLSKHRKQFSLSMYSDGFGCLNACTIFIVKKGLIKDIIYEVEFDPHHKIFQVLNEGQAAKRNYLKKLKNK